MKITVQSAADRDQMVVILARNGYTVRIGKEKAAGASKFTSFVEIVEKERAAKREKARCGGADGPFSGAVN